MSLTILLIVLILCPFSMKSAIRYVMAERAIREILAKRNLNNEQDIEKIEANKDYFLPVLINLLKDENRQVQVRAINLLGFIGDKKAVESLVGLLNNEDWQIRFFSAESLGLICDKSVIVPLTNRWLVENDWRVLREVTVALSRLNDKRVTSILDRYVDTDDNKRKLFRLMLLYKFTIENVYLEKLKKTLDSASDEDKIIAIWTIGKLEEKFFIPVVSKYLDSSNEKISNFAKKAIKTIKMTEKY